MYGKLEITGIIEVKTGMHIGGTNEFAAIGAIDSPVVRDPLTKLPIIPGSSLKGKMRTLLAKQLAGGALPQKPGKDPEKILRLFGASDSKDYKIGRLIFSDMTLSNKDDLQKRGARLETEVKFENTIDRLTAVANPRQIERVIRGAEFPLSIIYTLDNEIEVVEDFQTIKDGFELLKYDYLGGHGSRGSGKIEIESIVIVPVVGEISEELVEKLQGIFESPKE
ncbi:MAG: type III-A CRISPR-associated RAMP protein Csm3 [Fusobacteriaceae bacterium]|jgi:CRISPR-associated protein Csm3|nr:type III-A CRISPR-associated RAMP protein Csm3 [Fusobacteriaceae bacterium]